MRITNAFDGRLIEGLRAGEMRRVVREFIVHGTEGNMPIAATTRVNSRIQLEEDLVASNKPAWYSALPIPGCLMQ
jgi:hypothetical protein